MATTSSTGSVVLDSRPARRLLWLTSRRILLITLASALLVLSWRFAEVRPAVLFRSATAVALWKFLTGSFPPDVSVGFLRTVLRALAQTIATAVASTSLSIAFALPLSILATGTLWHRGVLVEADSHGFTFKVGAVASRLMRALLGFLRAVPDLVWALVFVAAVGLGPLAGTLALAISYTGVLGRVYADVFEHVDPQPLEALKSTGATRLQIFLRGVWPQALPHLTAYTLYSFECCVRAAAVLGFVGAGGIGYEIAVSMRLFEYGQVLTLLLVLIMLLTATDVISRRLRARVVKTPGRMPVVLAPRNTPDPKWWATKLSRLIPVVPISLLLLISFAAVGLTPHAMVDTAVAGRITDFVRGMLPPDFRWAFVSSLKTALLQTIAISMIATLIGIVLAAILAIPATSTLALVPSDAPGKHGRMDRAWRCLLFWSTRSTLNVLRSIPELVWVLICIVAVGIGPFAGAIALGLHTAGVLGKLYAETMEEVPARPVEALRSLGARLLQTIVWAIWPQARPMLISYTLLRWEMNLRASTILGLVGGGGLGMAIYNDVQLGFYPRLSTLILLIYGLVLASDWIGERLRLRVA